MGRPLLNVPIAFARVFDSTTRLNWLGGVLLYDQTDYADELRGHRTEPYPCRLGNLMSYAGLRQLGRFDQDLAHRRRVVRELERTLPGKGARLPRYDRRRARPSWVRYPFVVDDREAWIRRIRRLGIEPGTWLNDPIHPVRSNSDFAMYRRGSCPVAERIAKTILNVPVHSRMALWRIRRLRRLPPRDGAVAS
jgi:dTDP-4-amino-4,6-dideoxygalactose transaminase